LGFFYGEVGLLLCVGVLLWVRVLFAIITYSLDPMRSLHGYLLRHALLVAMFVGVMLVLFTYRVYQIFHDPPFFFKARAFAPPSSLPLIVRRRRRNLTTTTTTTTPTHGWSGRATAQCTWCRWQGRA
jgi:hypothetical protein